MISPGLPAAYKYRRIPTVGSAYFKKTSLLTSWLKDLCITLQSVLHYIINTTIYELLNQYHLNRCFFFHFGWHSKGSQRDDACLISLLLVPLDLCGSTPSGCTLEEALLLLEFFTFKLSSPAAYVALKLSYRFCDSLHAPAPWAVFPFL